MNRLEAYLSVTDVSEYAGLSIEGVRDLIDEGELDALELNGRTKIRKSEIDRWLDEHVNIEKLLELTDKMEGEVDVQEVASELDMDPEEVQDKIIDND
ncbi:MAG: helix-turn-helix domain-containing protein [Candidatus Bipolaricaulota bacterium]|nr:helix-turn-helix domain-containing protein [Candidatus Bipolaricaulota bacterium]MBS3791537.1 helix-turn-helix domain-containing protein [Candidatus Bipolaricaulota bacterium]